MYKPILVIYFFVSLSLVSCASRINQFDTMHLENIQKQHSDRFDFKIKDDVYFLVTDKLNAGSPNLDEELRSLLLGFKSGDQESKVVYLNYYNAKNEFQFQIHLDKNGSLHKENVDFH